MIRVEQVRQGLLDSQQRKQPIHAVLPQLAAQLARREPPLGAHRLYPFVHVTFTIREGRQFRIGRVEVTGNEVTKDKAVRRILDEYGCTPGQLYDAKMAPREGGGLLVGRRKNDDEFFSHARSFRRPEGCRY